MYEKKKILEMCDIRIAVTALCCFALFILVPQLNSVAVSAAALATTIFCSAGDCKTSLKLALTRVETVIIGAVIGAIVVYADELLHNDIALVLLSTLGTLAVLSVCFLVKLPYIQAKISCIIYVLVVIVMQGIFRVTYGAMFVLGTVIGMAVTVIAAFAMDLIKSIKK